MSYKGLVLDCKSDSKEVTQQGRTTARQQGTRKDNNQHSKDTKQQGRKASRQQSNIKAITHQGRQQHNTIILLYLLFYFVSNVFNSISETMYQ